MIKDRELTMHSKVVQCKGNIVSDMGGEKVMLSVERGKYFNLGAIGGDIWELMKQPVTVNELIHVLTQNYEVDSVQCEAQVMPFLIHLAKERLIEIVQ